MPKLVSLPDKSGPVGSARMWFNPEHVVSVVPKVSHDGTTYMLSVELKLTGVPLMTAWLGDYETDILADVAWHAFLHTIAEGNLS